MTENETWKDVIGYDGLYKVSDKGNVYSVGRVSSQGKKCGERILKLGYNRGGYLKVNLYKDGKMKTKIVHRLVAEAFIPNPESLPEINHIDEVKGNNNVENLEWCTSKYNSNHGTRNERVRKKVRAVNVETGEVLTFNSVKEAGRKGYDRGGVSKACRGVYYGGRTYKGYRWYYEEVGNETS